MKEHSDFHPQPKQEQDEPIAVVTGVYGGRFIVEPTNPAMVLPVNIALYTHPKQRTWVGLNLDDLPEIYVDDTAFLHGAQWAEAKLKEKNNG